MKLRCGPPWRHLTTCWLSALVALISSLITPHSQAAPCDQIKDKYEFSFSKQEKLRYLRELKKCRRANTSSRYQDYFKRCKAFRLKRAKFVGASQTKRKIQLCRLNAEAYEKSLRRESLDTCRVKACLIKKDLNMCTDFKSYGKVGVSDCRKLYAPLACMSPPKTFFKRYPNRVFWSAGAQKGNYNCSKI